MSHYRLQAAGPEGVVRLDTPLTAHEAYSRAVELRGKGYTAITATDTKTGRVIVDVRRLLRDSDA
jgi:hypothetical protein